MLARIALAFAFLAASAVAQQSIYGQCGGQGWTGQTNCVSGTDCRYQNDYYSQCLGENDHPAWENEGEEEGGDDEGDDGGEGGDEDWEE